MLNLHKLIFLGWLLVIILLAGCAKAGESTSTPPSPTGVHTLSSPTISAVVAAKPTEALASPTILLDSSASTVTITPSFVSPLPTVSSLKTSVTPTITGPDIDLIVDNRDPAFSTTGWWFIGDGGQSYNGDCAWAPPGVQNIAYVRPEVPQAGAYEIFAWWCGDPNHDQTQSALIQIYRTQEQVRPYQVFVNLQENAGQWNSLGTYYLEQNGSLSINSGLDANDNGNVVADAFRFVYRSSERVVITPTPRPTAFPWTNHPPSPLDLLTLGDLSARLGLVRHGPSFYPTIISMEASDLDDCQAFPRDDCGGVGKGIQVQVQYQDVVVMYRVSQDYRFVALEPGEALADRQRLYLRGYQENGFFQVDRYPDDTWHLSGADFAHTNASHSQLDDETLGTLHSLVQIYSSIRFEAPEGIELQLFGLGERVELSKEDQGRLAELGTKLAITASIGRE